MTRKRARNTKRNKERINRNLIWTIAILLVLLLTLVNFDKNKSFAQQFLWLTCSVIIIMIILVFVIVHNLNSISDEMDHSTFQDNKLLSYLDIALKHNLDLNLKFSSTWELYELFFNLASLYQRIKSINKDDSWSSADWQNFKMAKEILREYIAWVFISTDFFNIAVAVHDKNVISLFYHFKEQTLLQILSTGMVKTSKTKSYGAANFENFYKRLRRHYPEFCKLLDCNDQFDLAQLLKTDEILKVREAKKIKAAQALISEKVEKLRSCLDAVNEKASEKQQNEVFF
ncbi:hypothetical protein OZX69_06585 [Lactobacillus sp. ESL0731]|uniref:hypothetical protein n=1 Tax=unclassified Lactobacillus TaxID=2620435 RepID=UPI0023F9C01C|nr:MULTISPECIES: hypothetical protein [unclassified Lactobacillus]WEV50613.1 hypothetical protein OZX63_06580 [Lactobacillus sp. ESL0700]WEV61743.1 hypothetical protein OZX69_06585 [Lactobacillus sp. ESL0731]